MNERSKWRAYITLGGKTKILGRFATFYAACYARHYANIKYNFHPNHGITGDKHEL